MKTAILIIWLVAVVVTIAVWHAAISNEEDP